MLFNFMRKHVSYRLCSCTPEKGVVQISARILVKFVNREIHRIKCMENLRRKARRGLILGDICANTGHAWWAIKVWHYTSILIQERDYNDWRHADWNDRWYQLESMVSEDEARELGRRADDVWRALGHEEMCRYEEEAKDNYDFLWLEKWDIDRDEKGPEDEEPDTSIPVFRDGLPYWNPLQTQDFFKK